LEKTPPGPSASAATLDRAIGLPQATAMVVGIIVGVSIFVQPTEVSRYVPSVGGIFGVWIVAGALALCGALVCAELSSVYPETGGVYVFLNETISPAAGFLWGWAMFWCAHSGIIAAIAVVFGRYVAFFVPLSDTGIRLVAIGTIALLSLVNCAGVRQGSRLQTALTAAKILGIALILVLVGVLGRSAHAAIAAQVSPPARWTAADFALAVGAGVFAYGGWHMVTYSAGETRTPERTIPRALMIGMVVVTTSYLALNAACLYVLPMDQVVHSTRVAADAAALLAGPTGAGAISGLVLLSAFGVVNGTILAGPRVYLAMADRYRRLRWVGAVHPRLRTPYRAILVQALWSSVLVATGTYRELFSRVVYTEWLFFALMTVGLMRMRRRPGYAPVYRAWGYPVVPVLFIGASVGVVVFQVAADPWKAGAGLLIVAAGLPLYYLWVRPTTPSI
jgi:APA family basic amino acid/polyamine antiporter